MHEWVKDYQRITNEIDVLDYHIKKGVNISTNYAKQAIVDELNIILNETNKTLIKKEDQLLALKELSVMFTDKDHEIFVRKHIENQTTKVISHCLGISKSQVDKINVVNLDILEFYSEYN